MDITKELVDDLNAVVKIKLTPEDYAEKVSKTLKDQQKQAAMPGFRKGKVPFSLVKKMYGVSVKAQEINQLLNEGIHNYIAENKIDILGNPLPNEEQDIDWENQESFEFEYNLGLAPSFEVALNKKNAFDLFKIIPSEEMINEQIKEIASRYGKMENAEEAGSEDLLSVDVKGNLGETEINKEGSTLALVRVSEEGRKLFTGKKLEDTITCNVKDLFDSKSEQASLVGVEEDLLTEEGVELTLTLKTISRLVPAELNQELFDKTYGEGVVSSEAEMKAKIAEEFTNYLSKEGENKFKNDVIQKLIEKITFDLPDEFLKKWLMRVSEKPLTLEQIEADYENYAKGLKWQLIENKIIKDNDIKVEVDEVKEKTKELININMRQYGQAELPDAEMAGIIDNVLKNEEERRRVYEMLYEEKVIEVVKNSCKVEEKEISYDDFVKLVTENK